ncbi:MAG: archaeal proteasome endopeptidase complex subunit alpha [Candidatus Thorarchaeota archaeon]|nr:MAG: proteasome subunit alpha [Candidatus Thorarchaeota archaeon]RLI56543.1 MAG: proteasome subunit alpha [Candidatus Thorarchaeota archaeon]
MFGISGAGYDTSTGIFSPDGRIFAAEYAKKAVEQGATSIGILVEDGIVLLAMKKVEPLQEPDSVEKISKVDEHIGVATSGLMADARKLIGEARIKAQSYWLTYEEPVPGEAVAEHVCDVKAQFTQGGGARPYGVAMIIGSVDHDGAPRLFVTDPVGTYWGFLAAVIGRGTARAGEYLEKQYSKKKGLPEAIRLALSALREATEKEPTPANVEVATIPTATRKFEKLSINEVKKYLEPTKSKKKE